MRILLIEDDLTLNNNIREHLSSEGYTVDVAYDGSIAEKMLRKGAYNCIILDVNIPYKNGYEVCREFRKYNTSAPVLMLTAFDDLEDKLAGFDCGADDYVTKPFFLKELLSRIKVLIKRSVVQNVPDFSESIVIQDVVINQKNKTVKRENILIDLTPREYQILLKIALAKGELVHKKDLIRDIWGGSFDANTNTIEVYINFLRKKFDRPFKKQLIKTKVGFGYYLDIE